MLAINLKRLLAKPLKNNTGLGLANFVVFTPKSLHSQVEAMTYDRINTRDISTVLRTVRACELCTDLALGP